MLLEKSANILELSVKQLVIQSKFSKFNFPQLIPPVKFNFGQTMFGAG